MMGNYFYNHSMYGGLGFGWIGAILWWLFLVMVIVGLTKWLFGWSNTPRESNEDGTDSAMRVLRERYAKGDITRKEFLEMKKDLE